MSVSLEGICDKCEWHCQHGGPGATDEQEGDNLKVFVGAEGDEREADAAKQQAYGICDLCVFEAR